MLRPDYWNTDTSLLFGDVLLHLQLVQHHFQTLPDTTQKKGTKNGGVAYILQEFSWLQASTNTTSYNLVEEHMPMAW
jgi:hypothetical protein